MAKQIFIPGKENIKIIECTAQELMEAWGSPCCICDFCGKPCLPTDKGYYIAVLNQWKCEKCFEDYKQHAVWYPEDKEYEDRHFETAKRLFGI